MKKTLFLAILACLAVPVQATYYEITTGYQSGLTLQDSDSLLMSGGGLGELNLDGDNVTATIQGTSTLEQGTGGIWDLSARFTSHLDFSGGEVYEITMNNDATATLSGGRIDNIYSYQIAWGWDYGIDPPAQIPNPHITIECLDHFYNTNTKLLTGHWLDSGTAFSIQLIDVQGYSSAIDNIQFIPEPATLLLLGVGGLIIKRKK